MATGAEIGRAHNVAMISELHESAQAKLATGDASGALEAIQAAEAKQVRLRGYADRTTGELWELRADALASTQAYDAAMHVYVQALGVYTDAPTLWGKFLDDAAAVEEVARMAPGEVWQILEGAMRRTAEMVTPSKAPTGSASTTASSGKGTPRSKPAREGTPRSNPARRPRRPRDGPGSASPGSSKLTTPPPRALGDDSSSDEDYEALLSATPSAAHLASPQRARVAGVVGKLARCSYEKAMCHLLGARNENFERAAAWHQIVLAHLPPLGEKLMALYQQGRIFVHLRRHLPALTTFRKALDLLHVLSSDLPLPSGAPTADVLRAEIDAVMDRHEARVRDTSARMIQKAWRALSRRRVARAAGATLLRCFCGWQARWRCGTSRRIRPHRGVLRAAQNVGRGYLVRRELAPAAERIALRNAETAGRDATGTEECAGWKWILHLYYLSTTPIPDPPLDPSDEPPPLQTVGDFMASRIQALQKGRAARREVRRRRPAPKPAVAQTPPPAPLQRSPLRPRRTPRRPGWSEEDEAAGAIQVLYRGHRERKAVAQTPQPAPLSPVRVNPAAEEAARRHAAAVRLQAMQRGCTARKRVMAEQAAQEERKQARAAVKIQARFRGHIVRREAQSRARNRAAAALQQTRQLRAAEEEQKQARRAASAVVIQRSFRRKWKRAARRTSIFSGADADAAPATERIECTTAADIEALYKFVWEAPKQLVKTGGWTSRRLAAVESALRVKAAQRGGAPRRKEKRRPPRKVAAADPRPVSEPPVRLSALLAPSPPATAAARRTRPRTGGTGRPRPQRPPDPLVKPLVEWGLDCLRREGATGPAATRPSSVSRYHNLPFDGPGGTFASVLPDGSWAPDAHPPMEIQETSPPIRPRMMPRGEGARPRTAGAGGASLRGAALWSGDHPARMDFLRTLAGREHGRSADSVPPPVLPRRPPPERTQKKKKPARKAGPPAPGQKPEWALWAPVEQMQALGRIRAVIKNHCRERLHDGHLQERMNALVARHERNLLSRYAVPWIRAFHQAALTRRYRRDVSASLTTANTKWLVSLYFIKLLQFWRIRTWEYALTSIGAQRRCYKMWLSWTRDRRAEFSAAEVLRRTVFLEYRSRSYIRRRYYVKLRQWALIQQERTARAAVVRRAQSDFTRTFLIVPHRVGTPLAGLEGLFTASAGWMGAHSAALAAAHGFPRRKTPAVGEQAPQTPLLGPAGRPTRQYAVLAGVKELEDLCCHVVRDMVAEHAAVLKWQAQQRVHQLQMKAMFNDWVRHTLCSQQLKIARGVRRPPRAKADREARSVALSERHDAFLMLRYFKKVAAFHALRRGVAAPMVAKLAKYCACHGLQLLYCPRRFAPSVAPQLQREATQRQQLALRRAAEALSPDLAGLSPAGLLAHRVSKVRLPVSSNSSPALRARAPSVTIGRGSQPGTPKASLRKARSLGRSASGVVGLPSSASDCQRSPSTRRSRVATVPVARTFSVDSDAPSLLSSDGSSEASSPMDVQLPATGRRMSLSSNGSPKTVRQRPRVLLVDSVTHDSSARSPRSNLSVGVRGALAGHRSRSVPCDIGAGAPRSLLAGDDDADGAVASPLAQSQPRVRAKTVDFRASPLERPSESPVAADGAPLRTKRPGQPGGPEALPAHMQRTDRTPSPASKRRTRAGTVGPATERRQGTPPRKTQSFKR